MTFTQRKWRHAWVKFTQSKGENTHGICVTFTQRRVGQFHSEKRQKGVAVHTKIRVTYERKENNKEVYS